MAADPAALNPALAATVAAWADRAAWTVLDTDFQGGQRFAEIRQAWRQDARRPRMLHYVGITPPARAITSDAELAALTADLGPGTHRILLDGGQVSLTLCQDTLQGALSEQTFLADTLLTTPPIDKWAAQLLARRCKRTAQCMVAVPPDATGLSESRAYFLASGFVLDETPEAPPPWLGRFDPRWQIPTSRSASAHLAVAPGRCAVIGAGLSGACVAHALALRGWQVDVLDQEAAPARGASGLPVGLGVPHVSADDNPRSRLSRAGLRLMAQHAWRLLRHGQDWASSGVEERRPDGLPLWHAQAFWMKPATMVQALLAHDAIHWVANAPVAQLTRTNAQWCLHGAQGQKWGCFDVVVLANAMGAVPVLQKGLPPQVALTPGLLAKLAGVHAVHGTVSHGTYAEVLPGLPEVPVNGHGCFIPHIPGPAGEQWLAGATFETDPLAAADLPSQHAHNLQRLRELLPMADYDLPDTLDRGPVAQWTSTRCVTHDRLPLVGPIDTALGTGLWLCVGMGSRGLSFAALCAELLAARLDGEPLPVPASLARSLDVGRVRRKPAATHTTV